MTKVVNLLLVIVAAVFFVGCQKAKDIEPEPAEVNLVSPINGAQVRSLEDQALAIELKGGANKNGDLQLNLNGVSIYGEGSNTAVQSAVFVSSLFVQTQLSNDEIKPITVSGLNTVEVKIPSQGILKTFSFYLDNIKPQLAILSIEDSNIDPMNKTIKGRIISATTLDKDALSFINGKKETATLSGEAPDQMFEADIPQQYLSATGAAVNSPSVSYELIDNSGVVHKGQWILADAKIARTAETFVSYSAMDFLEKPINNLLAYGKVQLTDPDLGDLAPGKALDPFNRSTPTGSFTNPHRQVDDTNPIDYRKCIPGGVDEDGDDVADVDTQCYFGAIKGVNIPLLQIIPINKIPGSPCSTQLLDTNADIDACAFYLTDLTIKTPSLDFSWNKETEKPQLKADLKIPYGTGLSLQLVGLKYVPNTGGGYCVPNQLAGNPALSTSYPQALPFGSGSCDVYDTFEYFNPITQLTEDRNQYVPAQQIAGVRNGQYLYRGALKANVRLRETHIVSSFDVTKGSNGKIISVKRNGDFEASVNDVAGIFFGDGVDKPELYGTTCDICKVAGTNLEVQTVEAFYNFTNLSVDRVASLINSPLEGSLAACSGQKVSQCWKTLLTSELEQRLGAVLGGVSGKDGLAGRFAAIFNNLTNPLIDNETNFDLSAERITTHNYLESWLPNFLEPYAIGARFGFDGTIKYQNSNPAPEQEQRKSTATLVPFVKNGGFNDWMFYDKIFPDKQPVQFAFALSSNAINQYFASKFVKGDFKNYSIKLKGSDLASIASGFNENTVVPGNDYILNFTLDQAPSIKLQPFQKQVSYGGCIEFQGMGNCGDGDEYEKILQKEIKAQVLLDIPSAVVTLCNDLPGVSCTSATNNKLLSTTTSLRLRALVQGTKLRAKESFSEVLVSSVAPDGELKVEDSQVQKGKAAAVIAEILNAKAQTVPNLLSVSGFHMGENVDYEVRDAEELVGTSADWNGLFESLSGAGFDSPMALLRLSNSLPFAMGVSLKTLKIDAGGDYVTFAGNFNYLKKECDGEDSEVPEAEANKFIMAYCYPRVP